MPIWTPQHPEQTHMAAFMKHVNQSNYADLHAWSVQAFPKFWEAIAQFFKVTFDTPPTSIFEKTGQQFFENAWFKDATFNIAQAMLKGHPDQLAIIATNEQGHRRTFTYAELKKYVGACAFSLKAVGVQSGDRVTAIMPNVPETIIAMLATASIGAIWSSCSPDFGETALLDRLTQIEPSVLFVCDVQQYQGKTFEVLKKVEPLLKTLFCLKQVVVCSTSFETPILSANMMLWKTWVDNTAVFSPISLPFSHPLYILFSSGTTGQPKCIVHAAGHVYIQHLKELGLHSNMDSTTTLFFQTTCGWMMWNWMVSALSLSATLLLYDGSPTYPNKSKIFSLMADEKVTVLGIGARFLALTEKASLMPYQTHDLSHLKLVLSTASPLLPSQYDYFYRAIHPTAQLASISGGTDIVSCFALGNPILPIYKGEIQCVGLGMDIKAFNESGKAVMGQKGELVCCTPFPSMPLGFWKDTENKAYQKAYFSRFPEVWTHGDFIEITKHQGVIIYGRSDTTLNPGGVRIGTAEIYRIVETFPEIEESVVVGKDLQGDVEVFLFVKLKSPLKLDEALQKNIKQALKTKASPRHVPHTIIQVPDIPKTINGKVVEIAIKQVLEGQTVQNLGSIANPEALKYFKD